MIGVIYARFSPGPNQTEQSIEGQVADGMAFAERNGIKVIKVYADRKVSGKSLVGRDQFLQMMEDAEKHKFECVIVWKIDRFGRSRQDIAFNKYKLKRAGVKLMYSAETIPDTPEGIILESVMEGIAEYYSADLSQKVSRGMKESAKKGKVSWTAVPIGYKRNEEGLLEPIPRSLDAIREGFKMYANGCSLKELAAYLNENEVRTRTGGEITKGTLYRLLRNKAYLGTLEFMGVEIPIEQTVDKLTFDMVQERNHRTPSRNAAGKAKVNYLLSCKCYCGYCGNMLVGDTGTSKTGATHHYYKCGLRKRISDACKLRNFRKEDLERIVVKATMQDILNDSVIDAIVAQIMQLQEEERKDNPIEKLKRRLSDNKRKQANLVTAIENSGSSALVDRLNTLVVEYEELNYQYEKAKLQDVFIPEQAIRLWFDNFKNGDIENEDFQETLINSFIMKIVVTDTDLTIHYNATGMSSDTGIGMD